MNTAKTITERFFQDKHGKLVIGQSPNAPILAWAILVVANLFLHNPHVAILQNTVLFAWAYLELTEGVNYFRKLLGAVVLIGVTVGFFL